MSACVSVCLTSFLGNRVQTLLNFLYMLPVAVAQSSSGDSAQFSCTATCFHI